jgi:hypothetical protein
MWANSLDEFLKHKAYCDTSNVWWLKGGGKQAENEFDMIPSKDVHVLLRGAINEFAVTAKCSKQDYEYVLDQLRRNNK